MFLYRLVEGLRAGGVQFAVAGGYAVALHGAVRGTLDVDIVVKLTRRNFLAAEAALKRLGLQSRLPLDGGRVHDFREEYIKDRNLLAWNFYNSSRPDEVVDIVITHDLGRLKVETIPAGGHSIPVVALADLIAMKKASGRPQDIADIRALEKLRK